MVRHMIPNAEFEQQISCRLGDQRKNLDPCTLVIFGASGDLTARKLIPALYHLYREKQMPPAFRLIGMARREKTDQAWRLELRQALQQYSRTADVKEGDWEKFASNITYCHGDLTEPASYELLKSRIESAESEPLRHNLHSTWRHCRVSSRRR